MSRGNDSRLRVWREFRDSIKDLNDEEKLKAINNFWMLHPFMARTIDPDDSSGWMGAWDMVYYDQICEYSRAILIHQTALMMLSDVKESFLVYVIDSQKQNDYMLVVIDGKVLNYDFEISDYESVSAVVNIQNKFKSSKKGIYSIIK